MFSKNIDQSTIYKFFHNCHRYSEKKFINSIALSSHDRILDEKRQFQFFVQQTNDNID